MAGTSNVTGLESIIFADNASFDGTERGGRMTANGQLWIGSTVSRHVQLGSITSPSGSVTIGYSSPNITIDVTASGPVVETLTDDVGTLITPISNNIQLVGHVVEQGSTKFSTVKAGTHLANINPMSSSRWIVDPLGFNGTHTTIAAALTSATSGDTIFLLPGTYTENPALKVGVNISAYNCDALTPNVTISGKCTCSTAGTVTLSGINLQTNSDYCLEVTGSAATIIILQNCYITATASNNAFHHTSSSASSMIMLLNSKYNVGTNTMAISTSAGQVVMEYCEFDGSASSTASTFSAGFFQGRYSELSFPVTSTSTAGIAIKFCTASLGNVTNITHGGTGANCILENCFFASGSAVCVTVGTGATLRIFETEINSSNTNPISGLGTVIYGGITLSSSGVAPNTTTLTPETFYPGQILMPPTGNAGVTSNIMVTYEEGTWTPTLLGVSTAGTTTYGTQVGYYTKIGNMVTVWATIVISAASGTGNAQIGALPFTVKNQTSYAPIGVLFLSSNTWTWPATFTQVTINPTLNTTTAILQGSKTAGGNSAIQMANAAATFEFTLSYQV